MPEPKDVTHIIYCDTCHDLLMPGKGEKFYSSGGKIICTICWERP